MKLSSIIFLYEICACFCIYKFLVYVLHTHTSVNNRKYIYLQTEHVNIFLVNPLFIFLIPFLICPTFSDDHISKIADKSKDNQQIGD